MVEEQTHRRLNEEVCESLQIALLILIPFTLADPLARALGAVRGAGTPPASTRGAASPQAGAQNQQQQQQPQQQQYQHQATPIRRPFRARGARGGRGRGAE